MTNETTTEGKGEGHLHHEAQYEGSIVPIIFLIGITLLVGLLIRAYLSNDDETDEKQGET